MTNRVLISQEPYRNSTSKPQTGETQRKGAWPAKWISHDDDAQPPFVCAFRNTFTQSADAIVRLHVTADQRYDLFLDGELVGRGSERGDANHWFFETYDLHLAQGEHTIVARTWFLPHISPSKLAPFAQHSIHAGFLLSPDDENLAETFATGIAPWQVKHLGGYEFTDPSMAWGKGANVVVHGDSFSWGFERGDGDNWQTPRVLKAGVNASTPNETQNEHLLMPAILPAQIDELQHIGRVVLVSEIETMKTCDVPIREIDNVNSERLSWQKLMLSNDEITIAANTRHRVLVDLENYYCARPELTTSGGAGAVVRVHWQEALFEQAKTSMDKGNRDQTEGKYFRQIWMDNDGLGDTFLPDGGAHRFFSTLWWNCGRFVEIVVETQAEPLTIHSFALRETRYPLELESHFESSDARLKSVEPLMVRAMQMCSHETYMDCPFYEQLQYIGDTRLEVLTHYIMARDDLLPRKAMRMFDASRVLNGLTQSRYPSRILQMIPPFSLWYVAMLHDFAMWKGDREFLRVLVPGARGVLDHFLNLRDENGLIGAPEGWNYIDCVKKWENGGPVGADSQPSGPLNWTVVWVLKQFAEIEEGFGEPELATRNRRAASELARNLDQHFWDDGRELYADDLAHTSFSEHSQCLAILGGEVSEEKQNRIVPHLLNDDDLARTTIMFSHYLFETLNRVGHIEKFFERIEKLWFSLHENGLKTTIEMPEPTRSDCHAWAAHPLLHQFTTLLGIRPASWGFATVEIAPQLGHLAHARGTMPHPQGEIAVELRRDGDTLHADVTLPDGVSGVFRYAGKTMELHGGAQKLSV